MLKWSNIIIHQQLNGPNNFYTNWKETIMLLQHHILSLLPHLRNYLMKRENKYSRIFSSMKMVMKKLLLLKSRSKVWKLTWLIYNLSWNKLLLIQKRRWNKLRSIKQRLMFWKKVSKVKKKLLSKLLMQPTRSKQNVRLIWLRPCQLWEQLKMHWKSWIRNNWISSRQWKNHQILSELSWRHFVWSCIQIQHKK